MSLSKLRISKGITQEQMAKMLGIGVSTYNQHENSQRTIPYEIAEKIAEILDVGIEDIFLPVRFTVSKLGNQAET
ncbi:helix-turn-helix transcriptional regulator [Desulforamulus aquiferis]|uniref:Helix-turn-helix transcriptional regulator n=1 Tax=Desulforamulus aquiferis TaxID=1397668 RepID=A0AAW7ZF64_9FIRM|nr:helix-turn-helix transcriptional regulator [Desulforamulus aquiferis]MDO7787900.1 helix-turn-helix transcriptional regulator [Desulforamulus aquiferis]